LRTFYTVGNAGLRQYAHGAPSTLRRRGARPARAQRVPAGGSGDVRHAAAASTRLLGITGDVTRFKNQTGQQSQVRQAFLGWGQGQSYGSRFAALLPTLAPIPMLHLGTGGPSRRETITPQGSPPARATGT